MYSMMRMILQSLVRLVDTIVAVYLIKQKHYLQYQIQQQTLTIDLCRVMKLQCTLHGVEVTDLQLLEYHYTSRDQIMHI